MNDVKVTEEFRAVLLRGDISIVEQARITGLREKQVYLARSRMRLEGEPVEDYTPGMVAESRRLRREKYLSVFTPET